MAKTQAPKEAVKEASKTTELTVINNTPVPVEVEVEYVEPTTQVDNGNWGDEEPAKPQYIALKQPTTDGADDVPNGHFYHKASGQTWPEVKMVILQMNKGRAWKPSAPAFVQGEKVLCKSVNRTQYGGTPITDSQYLEPQAKECAKCSKNSWANYDKATKTGDKPVCQKDFFFLFLDSETLLPYIYTVNGNGVPPSDALYDALRAKANLVKAKSGRMPNTFEFEVSMTSEKVGKYYVPKFTKVRQLTTEQATEYGPLYEQFVLSRQNRKNSKAEEVEVDEVEETEDTGQVLDGDVAEI